MHRTIAFQFKTWSLNFRLLSFLESSLIFFRHFRMRQDFRQFNFIFTQMHSHWRTCIYMHRHRHISWSGLTDWTNVIAYKKWRSAKQIGSDEMMSMRWKRFTIKSAENKIRNEQRNLWFNEHIRKYFVKLVSLFHKTRTQKKKCAKSSGKMANKTIRNWSHFCIRFFFSSPFQLKHIFPMLEQKRCIEIIVFHSIADKFYGVMAAWTKPLALQMCSPDKRHKTIGADIIE